MTRRALAIFLALALPAAARADGAFPDELQILLPADRPHEILLATNFGLAVSEDDGANWYLACEQAIATYAALYALGPAPDDTVFAAAPAGLAISRDRGCSWSMAGGALAGAYVSDEFPDPSDATRVLALARSATDGGGFVAALYASADGGRTFGAPRYAARPGDVLNGVEIARADPLTVYLTSYSGQAPFGPTLLRSTDGGANFLSIDESAVTTSSIFLAAVDPVNPQRVYFRLRNGTVDDLGITDDGGDHIRVALHLDDELTAFLRRADGTLLAGVRYAASYISTDGGQTFQAWAHAPHLRALAERGDWLYGAGDNITDGFALARTADNGETWQPILNFADLKGPLACGNLTTECATPWQQLMSTYGIGVEPSVDAGPRIAGDASPGCGCELGVRAPVGGGIFFAALALAFALTRRSRR